MFRTVNHGVPGAETYRIPEPKSVPLCQASQRLFRAIAKEVQTCLPTANTQELLRACGEREIMSARCAVDQSLLLKNVVGNH